MRNSLREQLNSYIRVNGVVSYNTLKDLVESGFFGKKYRASTMERRLRSSESPMVDVDMDNGYIIRYRWIGTPLVFKEFKVYAPNGEVERVIKLPI